MKRIIKKINIIIIMIILCTIVVFPQNAIYASDFSEGLLQKTDEAIILYIGSSKTFVNNIEALVDSTNPNVYPFIKDGRTLVPVRFISQNIGATVEWEGETSTVIIKQDTETIKLTIGSKIIDINGVFSELDVPAQIVNERTFIPLRALVEALGKKVFWDDRGLIVISDVDNIFDTDKEADLIDELVCKIKPVNTATPITSTTTTSGVSEGGHYSIDSNLNRFYDDGWYLTYTVKYTGYFYSNSIQVTYLSLENASLTIINPETEDKQTYDPAQNSWKEDATVIKLNLEPSISFAIKSVRDSENNTMIRYSADKASNPTKIPTIPNPPTTTTTIPTIPKLPTTTTIPTVPKLPL